MIKRDDAEILMWAIIKPMAEAFLPQNLSRTIQSYSKSSLR